MEDGYYYLNSFGKKQKKTKLSLALLFWFPVLTLLSWVAVFAYSKYRTTFFIKSKMEAPVSDDDDPMKSIQIV